MAGKLVPLVILPRYSSFAGRDMFTTVPVDVTDYARAILTCWRGPLKEPANATIAFICQESSDQVTWETCTGTNVSFDPGESVEGVTDATLKRRWFRMTLSLQSSATYQNLLDVSCWAVGHLEQRQP